MKFDMPLRKETKTNKYNMLQFLIRLFGKSNLFVTNIKVIYDSVI